MSFELAQKVADAVLYEGYVLYPYRASAGKNRIRWQFGCVVPAGYAELGGSEPSAMQTECLIEPAGSESDMDLDLRVRFLQVQARTIEENIEGAAFRPVETLEVGDRMLVTWEEGVERRFDATAIPLRELLAGERRIPIELPAGREIEEVRGEDGRVVARIVRERWPISGLVRVAAEPQAGLIKLRVRIENLDGWKESADREQALRRSMIGAHTLLAVRGGAFVSLLDPPAEAATAVADCENLHTWPVLIGAEDSRDVVLSSPIILYDHPAVAAESAGDFCDATEIDEILTLRVMTLTEDEKREARGTDERSRQIIERSDAASPESFERMHGVVRSQGTEVPGAARTEKTLAELAEWETFLNPPGVVPPEEAEIEVSGVVLSQGSRVRLRPTRRADSMDLFLAGRVARVEGVYRDVEDVAWVAVSLDGDPASDLHSSHGRFFYFYPDEVEPLEADAGERLDAERRAYETSDSGRAGLDGDLGHHPVDAGPGAIHENLADVAAPGAAGTLIACVGNIFLGDDGFGVEVARHLATRELPDGVRAVDFGIRGVHLAYEMADKSYETAILVDATPRGGTPGTVYLIEPDLDRLGEAGPGAADAHGMDPQTVFSLLRTLGGKPGRVLIVGCEPASTDDEIGLSEPVAAAVGEAVALILELVGRGDPVVANSAGKEESPWTGGNGC